MITEQGERKWENLTEVQKIEKTYWINGKEQKNGWVVTRYSVNNNNIVGSDLIEYHTNGKESYWQAPRKYRFCNTADEAIKEIEETYN